MKPEPEYQVESEKTSQEWDLGRISHLKYRGRVQARSRELYTSLTLVIGTLDRIQDLVRELEQLQEAHQ